MIEDIKIIKIYFKKTRITKIPFVYFNYKNKSYETQQKFKINII